MKLKGERAINRSLNRWLRKYGFDARVKGLDTDFFWYHTPNTIGYCFVQTDEVDYYWEKLLTELGLKYEIATFWTSFLHELGHSMTWDFFDNEEIEDYDEAIAWLRREDASSFVESVHEIYFHLPIEIAATRWAVNFINTNPKAIEELTKTVSPKIQRFYKLNKITKI